MGAAAGAGQGCVDRSIDVCGASLAAAMPKDRGLIEAAMRRSGVDVNGRPIARRAISVSGVVPGHVGRLLLVLYPGSDNVVASAEAVLQDDPITARTETDYERTGLYEAVTLLLGDRCPQADPIHVYRYFQNYVKPRLVTEKTESKPGMVGRNTLTTRAAGLPFCGVQFSFTRSAQWTGTADLTRAYKVETASIVRLDRRR